MTITNEERREVSENLRTMTMRGCRYKEEFYDLLNETVMNEWDFHSFSDVAERIADLIEPEPERTCRNLSDEYCQFKCSNCGREFNTKSVYSFNCCPNCGAKIEQ